MLKGTVGLFGRLGVLVGAAMLLPSCGGTGGVEGCTPNEVQFCPCAGGGEGVQTCQGDGQGWSVCDCGDGTGGRGGDGGSGTTQTGACGDGAEDPGECDTGSENYCPQDCMGTGGSGGTGGSTNTCVGKATYGGSVMGVGPDWGNHPQSNGKTGYEAGVEICKSIGADHPCEYQEVVAAELAGELAAIPQGTSAWIHRTTDAEVNGTVSVAGPGGRCNNWVYTTNHISDGEYATFDMVGIPTYHLDNDTFYDGVDITHANPTDLQCGGMIRDILCCFPICVP
jgi:hypothetical protein